MGQKSNLKIPFKILNVPKMLEVPAMLTWQEKEILELLTIFPDIEKKQRNSQIFDQICNILGIPKDLPLKLKMVLFYAVREVSFGSDVDINFKCKQCQRANSMTLEIENLLQFEKMEGFNIDVEPEEFIQLINDVEQVNIKKLAKYYNVSSLATMNQLVEVSRQFRKVVPNIKDTLKCKCMFCQKEHEVKILTYKFLFDSVSKYDYVNLLKTYQILIEYGFTKEDIDSMLPFERELHIGIIQQKLKGDKK